MPQPGFNGKNYISDAFCTVIFDRTLGSFPFWVWGRTEGLCPVGGAAAADTGGQGGLDQHGRAWGVCGPEQKGGRFQARLQRPLAGQ